MKISQWRNDFLDWLGSKVVINSFYLEVPENVGDTNAFLTPLRNIKNYLSDDGQHCTATQDVYLATRYSRDLAYYELPISTIEGLYSTVAHALLAEYQDINEDILEIILNPSEDSIEIGEYGDESGDWIVKLKWIITVRFIYEPETPRDFLITKINLGLYRQLLDESGRTLDYIYDTPEVFEDLDSGLIDDQGNLLTDEP